MKLRNKLIPLMAVATATSCAAPIATSCSNFAGGLVDITKNYTPTIAKAEASSVVFTEAQAQDLYFTHLAENPQILKQDVLVYEVAKLPSRINKIEHWIDDDDGGYYDLNADQTYICSNVKAGVNVRNISSRRVTTVVNNKEKVFYTISCVLEYVFNYTATSVDGTYAYTSNSTFRAALNDIPTEVYGAAIYNPTGDTTTIKWKISNNFLNSTYLTAVPGWSYTFNEETSVTETYVDDHGCKRSETEAHSRDGLINREAQITEILDNEDQSEYLDEILQFESYHLSDVLSELSADFKPLANSEGVITGTVKYAAPAMKWTTSIDPLFKLSDDALSDVNSYSHNYIFRDVDDIYSYAVYYRGVWDDNGDYITNQDNKVLISPTNPDYTESTCLSFYYSVGKSSTETGFAIANNEIIYSPDYFTIYANGTFNPEWQVGDHLKFQIANAGSTWMYLACDTATENIPDEDECSYYTFELDEQSNGLWVDLTVVA